VILHTETNQGHFLDQLGAKWYLDYSDNVSNIPAGKKKLIHIGSLPGPSSERIKQIAQQAPGSIWYILGEPNRTAGLSVSDTLVTRLHSLYTAIKAADPTAKITSPSVLNWDFTCIGCAGEGYQSGHSWTEQFLATYRQKYNAEPPIDIWAIDTYPLDWKNLPTVNHQIVIDQITGLRQYLNGLSAHRDKPIMITELALHWGYSCPRPQVWPEGCFLSSSQGIEPQLGSVYQEEAVKQYLNNVFNWLEANADSLKIEKWFIYRTYFKIGVGAPNQWGYHGLTMFNGPSVGANLTPIGQLIKNRIQGIK